MERNYQYKKFCVMVPNRDWTWREIEQYDSLAEAVKVAAETNGAVMRDGRETVADFSR